MEFPDFAKFLSPDFVKPVIQFATTAFGVWFGATLALRKDKLSSQKSQIGAGNRALFQLHRMFQAASNLQSHCINPQRGNPHRWLEMDSPFSGMVDRLKFDVGDLGFFLDHPSPKNPAAQTLSDLFLLETKFGVLIDLLDKRAQVMNDELFPAIHKQVNTAPLHEVIKSVHHPIYAKLVGFTDQIVERTDELVIQIEQVYINTQNSLQFLLPKANFIEIKFSKQLPPT